MILLFINLNYLKKSFVEQCVDHLREVPQRGEVELLLALQETEQIVQKLYPFASLKLAILLLLLNLARRTELLLLGFLVGVGQNVGVVSLATGVVVGVLVGVALGGRVIVRLVLRWGLLET